MACGHGRGFVHHEVGEALEERRRQLATELGRLAARMRERGAEAVLEPDRLEGSADDVDTTLVTLKHATLRRVEAALARVRNGRYGRCTRCGGPIAEARLRAMPFAVRCRGCEAARERSAATRSTVRDALTDHGGHGSNGWRSSYDIDIL